MANKLYEESNIQDIALAIREQNGTDTKYNVSQMGEAVRAIRTGSETAEYTWNQIPTAVKSFLDNVTYDPSDYSTSQIASYAPATADVNNTYPIGKVVETDNGILDRDGYEMAVQSGNTTLYNDIPNRYSEYVNRNNGAVSRVGTLKPTGTLRQIKCATSNVRDLGGWACDGGTVKYGKLFRGGEFQAADADIFINQLGIRHELNLRGMAEAEDNPTTLRDYVGFTCPEQYVWYVIIDAYKETWKEIIRCAFDCATKNKPLYFHCSSGADRTGTVACILEAILGVSQSDIDKDYELTCFATGVSTDNLARRRNESEWKSLINQINAITGSTFHDKVINWVASLGFTADEINAYRSAMIDGTPSAISLNVATYSVTNILSNVTTDNSATTVKQYQPYEANIAVADGYAIDNVKVTMGGVDVTASVFKGEKTNLNYGVTLNLENCTTSNKNIATMAEQAYVAFIEANTDYTLEGATVSITMGGADVSKYYSDGKIAIPNVTGDLVITISAVKTASKNVPIVWKNGYTFGYSVGSNAVESENASYIVTEEMDVEYGTTYTFDVVSPATDFSIYFIGITDASVVTENYKFQPNKSGAVSYSWTPTKNTTTKLRLRGYSSAATNLMAVTELKVS